MCANSRLQRRVFEVHPELSFAEWNGGVPLNERKKSRAGKAARQSLIGAAVFHAARQCYPVGSVEHDDIADAFAALWTAERKYHGQAIVIPANPAVDEFGIRMEIWR